MEDLIEEQGVPKNVKEMLRMAINELEDEEQEENVRLQAATSLLDQVSNDLNLSQYMRTEIWSIASLLENNNA